MRKEVADAQREKMRALVEKQYVHVPLREKDTGAKLEALYGAYTSATPPVHTKIWGRNTFARMLGAAYAGIGPHKSTSGTVGGIFAARCSALHRLTILTVMEESADTFLSRRSPTFSASAHGAYTFGAS